MPAVNSSGFWGNDGAYSLLINKPPIRNRIKQTINADQMRAVTALFNGLIGAAVGSNVTATHKRVSNRFSNTPGNNETSFGTDTITVTDINRNTTAADVTALKEMVYGVTSRPAVYPRDLSGNGGPQY